ESESDIRPPKSRKRNIIVSDSDDELEEEWNKHDMTPNLPNYLNIPSATIELVVTQTNLYYSQMKALHKISTKTESWTEVTINEIKKFLGLPILMDQTRKSYFERLLALYIPKQELTSDKAMESFRELISFRTYNPAKLTKQKVARNNIVNIGPYLGGWNHIYQDYYYKSVSTAELLIRKKTLVCGIIRKNCGLPKVLLEKSKSLHRGEMTFLRKGPVVFIAWTDKRIVRMVSIIHDALKKSSGNRKKNYKDDTIKPTCILQYNKHMKEGDRADQYLANSSIFQKNVTSYKKLAFFLINYTLFNAYKINCTYRPESKIRYKKFLLEVAREWITVVSKESSTAPDTSGRSQTAPSKDPPSI
ncbi:hypothetical protein M0802_015435, partial [Mischocyttarus mexicanus]